MPQGSTPFKTSLEQVKIQRCSINNGQPNLRPSQAAGAWIGLGLFEQLECTFLFAN